MKIDYREYDPQSDRDAAIRIWKEVGWLSKGEEEGFDRYITGSRGMVALVDGSVECFVLTTDGSIRHLQDDLPLCAVTGVTTGRVARRLGLARKLLALALARDASAGAAVSALGVFEHGFYDRLGYGTGAYSRRVRFDPAQLTITRKARVPERLTSDDWEAAHMARLQRRRLHGSCNLFPKGISQADMAERDKAFGMGYRDAPGGALSHYVWCTADNMERGPYRATCVFQTAEQLEELLALLKSLADQVILISMEEPPGIMLQDWLDKPFRHMSATEDGKHEVRIGASAYWQARVMDLSACLAATHLSGPTVDFNLVLDDPIEALLSDQPWSGVGGRFVVTLGPDSRCAEGEDSKLPTMHASVGAFTRMWLGVRPPSGLAITDAIRAPESLLSELDVALRMPEPQTDWDF